MIQTMYQFLNCHPSKPQVPWGASYHLIEIFVLPKTQR